MTVVRIETPVVCYLLVVNNGWVVAGDLYKRGKVEHVLRQIARIPGWRVVA